MSAHFISLSSGINAKQCQVPFPLAIVYRARANALKDEFLGIISHDLRTPLNSIVGWVEIAEADGVENAPTAKALSIIKRNAAMQSHLIDNLLDVIALAAGTLTLNLEAVDVSSLVESGGQRFYPSIAEKRINFAH